MTPSGPARPNPRTMLSRLRFRWCVLAVLSLAIYAWPSAAQNAAANQSRNSPQAHPRFLITGIVINDTDGSPLPRCRLAATLSVSGRRDGRQLAETQTDEHGRFSLEVGTAGNWRLTASGRNVHTQPYEDHDGFFTGIVLTEAEPTYRLTFRATPDAVLGGAIVDEAGEAVRNAPVFLTAVDSSAGTNLRTQQTTTDDRGRYEFAGLEAGAYLVNVRARPWYALQTGFSQPNTGSTSPDPSLDLVYPITWYPGTTDERSATPLNLRAGERAVADFHLQPIPSAHLLLPVAATQPPGTETRIDGIPRGQAQVALLLPNGGLQPVFGNYSNSVGGELDMGGLAPGTYQVTYPGSGPDAPGRTAIVTIGAGGTFTEVGAGGQENALTLSVEGDSSVEAAQVILVDTTTRRIIRPLGRGGRPGGPNGGTFVRSAARRPDQPATPSTDTQRPANGSGSAALDARQSRPPVTVNLPPGRYEVSLPPNSGAFLTGLSVSGNQASVEGRYLTMRDGSASLVVHVAPGLATVEGTAMLQGRPAAGALILLVPATLGSPTSLAAVRRDQSNTDGSFRITGVIPGQYILVAIEHGWSLRWADPATLQPYLLRGSPLELAPAATARISLPATTR